MVRYSFQDAADEEKRALTDIGAAGGHSPRCASAIRQRARHSTIGLVDAVLDHAGLERRSLHERLAYDDLIPGDDLGLVVEAGARNRPILALVGPIARAARLLIGEELTNSARPDDFRT